MIPDLAADPTAFRSSPVRGTPQPILPTTPLRGNGTTSSGGTSGPIGGGDRTYESRERQRQLHEISNPPPDAYDLAVANYRARQAADEASEKRQREQRASRIRREEEQTQARIERLRKTADFKRQEQLIETVIRLHGLNASERSVVWTKLLQSSNPLSTDIAEAACVEIEMTRDTRPVVAPVDAGFDWRGGLRNK